jgi:hypothetical protein
MRTVVKNEPSESAAFLASGLIHQFGNLLFTIQGHTSVLDVATLPRSRTAIQTACDRGTASLRLFRHLLGEPGSSWLPIETAANLMLELLRVPVREAGHSLEAKVVGQESSQVDLASFVPLMVATVRALIASVPTGVAGTLALAVQADGGRAQLTATFRPPADSLPFPLGIEAAADEVRRLVAKQRHPATVRGHDRTLGFSLPVATGVLEA